MGLAIIDRIKAVCRVVKIAANPNTTYINLLWVEEQSGKETEHLTHTFFKNGEDNIKPFLHYMAKVAGSCDSVDMMNVRAEFYLNKVAVAYNLFNDLGDNELCYIAEPLRLVPKTQKEESHLDKKEG